jgi:hypothetical protein
MKVFRSSFKGISERAEDGGGVREKTAIEIDEAKETLELFD